MALDQRCGAFHRRAVCVRVGGRETVLVCVWVEVGDRMVGGKSLVGCMERRRKR